MRATFAPASALGAALALAITLTSTVAPAFAETPKIDVTPSKPTIHRDLGPLPAPKPSTVTFVPDVRVNYVGKSSAGGGKVDYRFRVQNVGAASASNVGLDTRTYQQSLPTFPATEAYTSMQSGSGGTISSLGQDQTEEITITCTPIQGSYCDGARLSAIVADDLDESNNTAVSQ
jgi:hypothetical protein